LKIKSETDYYEKKEKYNQLKLKKLDELKANELSQKQNPLSEYSSQYDLGSLP